MRRYIPTELHRARMTLAFIQGGMTACGLIAAAWLLVYIVLEWPVQP